MFDNQVGNMVCIGRLIFVSQRLSSVISCLCVTWSTSLVWKIGLDRSPWLAKMWKTIEDQLWPCKSIQERRTYLNNVVHTQTCIYFEYQTGTLWRSVNIECRKCTQISFRHVCFYLLTNIYKLHIIRQIERSGNLIIAMRPLF